MAVRLRGSSWAHVRGHEPLVEASAAYARAHDVEIEWVPRTLTEFGVLDIGDLARQFDLVVIDHPHVGTVAASRTLVPLEEVLPKDALEDLDADSPGRSEQSYRYDGHQWALAIDAACQVSARRAGSSLPTAWADVADAARDGVVLWPLNPVDSQASFLTVCAQLGSPVGGASGDFVDPSAGVAAFELMASVARHLEPRCFDMNAIDVLGSLSAADSRELYCPLVFGYTNYSRPGFAPERLEFGDIPQRSPEFRGGALLGGVGLGVSALRDHIDEAAAFALWVAGADVQSSIYVEAGGQPAHGKAWSDPHADEVAGGFFSNVRGTMDRSWMRPRVNGYVQWQNASMGIVHETLCQGSGFAAAVQELNRVARDTCR